MRKVIDVIKAKLGTKNSSQVNSSVASSRCDVRRSGNTRTAGTQASDQVYHTEEEEEEEEDHINAFDGNSDGHKWSNKIKS